MQVGRFGLVTSCIAVGEEEVAVSAAQQRPAESLAAALPRPQQSRVNVAHGRVDGDGEGYDVEL